MKYIITKNKNTGLISPMVFDEEIVHRDVARGAIGMDRQRIVTSAGMVGFSKAANRWVVYGESESLQMKPDVNDETILNLFLVQGISGLGLQNHLTLLELKSGNLG